MSAVAMSTGPETVPPGRSSAAPTSCAIVAPASPTSRIEHFVSGNSRAIRAAISSRLVTSRAPGDGRSDPQQAAEASCRVVRLHAVVVDEDLVVSAVAEEGAAERTHVGRRHDPARGLGVELAELLQRAVLLLGEHFDAERCR